MTWIDPIVEEVRRVREAYAAKFNYDLEAIVRDLKEQERLSGLTYVSPPKHLPLPVPPAPPPVARATDGVPPGEGLVPVPDSPALDADRR